MRNKAAFCARSLYPFKNPLRPRRTGPCEAAFFAVVIVETHYEAQNLSHLFHARSLNWVGVGNTPFGVSKCQICPIVLKPNRLLNQRDCEKTGSDHVQAKACLNFDLQSLQTKIFRKLDVDSGSFIVVIANSRNLDWDYSSFICNLRIMIGLFCKGIFLYTGINRLEEYLPK